MRGGLEGWRFRRVARVGVGLCEGGVGAVAAGGIISLFRSLPTIWHGLKGGLRDLRGGQSQTAMTPRTDQDLSMKFVLAGIIALIAMIMIFPQLHLQ